MPNNCEPRQTILDAVDADVVVSDDADAFKNVSDQTGRSQQVCKSHVVRNTEALVEELSAMIDAGQDHSLEAIHITPEQALEDLASLKEMIHSRRPVPGVSGTFFQQVAQFISRAAGNQRLHPGAGDRHHRSDPGAQALQAADSGRAGGVGVGNCSLVAAAIECQVWCQRGRRHPDRDGAFHDPHHQPERHSIPDRRRSRHRVSGGRRDVGDGGAPTRRYLTTRWMRIRSCWRWARQMWDSGLFQGITIDVSLSSTASGEAAGERTQLSSLVSAGVILAVVVFLAPLLRNLPTAVLGAIVLHLDPGVVQLREFRRYYRQRKTDFVLAVTALVGVLTTSVMIGLAIAALLSVVMLLYRARVRTSRPGETVERRVRRYGPARGRTARPRPGDPAPGCAIVFLQRECGAHADPRGDRRHAAAGHSAGSRRERRSRHRHVGHAPRSEQRSAPGQHRSALCPGPRLSAAADAPHRLVRPDRRRPHLPERRRGCVQFRATGSRGTAHAFDLRYSCSLRKHPFSSFGILSSVVVE